MRRLLIAVAAFAAFAALGPAAALGWGSRDHSGSHDQFAHARDFGLRDTTPPVIGKVTSNTGGVVGIQLLNGSTASGAITGDTTVLCIRHTAMSGMAHQSSDRRDRRMAGFDRRFRRFERGFRGFDAWAHSSGLSIGRCVPGDARPPRRVAGALLQGTATGFVWRLLVIWA